MITTFYAMISAVIIVWLSLRVINVRRSQRVSVGDGDNEQLKVAMAAQSNAIEYLPITLILLFSLEGNGGKLWQVHLFGVMLILGRMIHAKGMLGESLNIRVLGMQVTIFTILGLAATNFFYLPFYRFAFWE